MNTTVDNPEAGKMEQPPALTPAVEAKALKRKCSFEEWCDKLQRFSIRTAVWSALGTLGVALVCGVVYLIAMWQLAD